MNLRFAFLFSFFTVFAVAPHYGCNDTGGLSDRGKAHPPFVYQVPDQSWVFAGMEEHPSDTDDLVETRSATHEAPGDLTLATAGRTASGSTDTGWQTTGFAVAAANPLATDAGYQVLKAGGNAVDAAIAIQMVLTLVEPQSSGIGGGAFLMFWDGDRVHAYDGRETTPAGADETLFLDEDGDPLPFREAVHSGLSVGVPGTIAMLKRAHEKHGLLPWELLFEPAVTLSEEGFLVSPLLHRQARADRRLRDDPESRAYFYDSEGDAHPVGFRLRNPALAKILRSVARGGPDAFYHGDVAADIVRKVRTHPRPGSMTVEDLMAYPDQEFQREAICTPWRTWLICGFPPPSSGHLTVMQILGIMEHAGHASTSLPDAVQSGSVSPISEAETDFPLTYIAEEPVPSVRWLHKYLEAAKLAYADRDRYIADPAFVDPPADDWESLLDPGYLAGRAALIGDRSMGRAEPGDPAGHTERYGNQLRQPESGTSHISIVDRNGHVVSMTTTIEQVFGSRMMSDGGTGLNGGFVLNNELTDLSLRPFDEQGRPIANRVQPGKRPRSSMAPTLVFELETGEFVAALGSPGGAGIIHFTAKTLLGMLDFGLDAQQAINLPNFVNYNGPTRFEAGRFPPEIIEGLRARGHEVAEGRVTSGLQAIQRTPTGYFGGADPRREGVVMGE